MSRRGRGGWATRGSNPFVTSDRPTLKTPPKHRGGAAIFDYRGHTIEVTPSGDLGWRALVRPLGHSVDARTEAGALTAMKFDLDAREAYGKTVAVPGGTASPPGKTMWFWLKHWAQKVGEPWGALHTFRRPSRNDVSRMLEVNRIDHRRRKRDGEPNDYAVFDWFDSLPLQDRVRFVDRAIDSSEAKWTPAPTRGQVLFTSRAPNVRQLSNQLLS